MPSIAKLKEPGLACLTSKHNKKKVVTMEVQVFKKKAWILLFLPAFVPGSKLNSLYWGINSSHLLMMGILIINGYIIKPHLADESSPYQPPETPTEELIDRPPVSRTPLGCAPIVPGSQQVPLLSSGLRVLHLNGGDMTPRETLRVPQKKVENCILKNIQWWNKVEQTPNYPM